MSFPLLPRETALVIGNTNRRHGSDPRMTQDTDNIDKYHRRLINNIRISCASRIPRPSNPISPYNDGEHCFGMLPSALDDSDFFRGYASAWMNGFKCIDTLLLPPVVIKSRSHQTRFLRLFHEESPIGLRESH